MITVYPENIKFKYKWRSYQQRVLDELQHHLTDKHLHVIAPPGSGKTVLGLQVALQLNKPTLILAPTISIRNQWIQRFCELFLQSSTTPDWISRDIRNPKFMTVITYQALHAACKKDVEKIIDGLKAQNTQTIVVDEAHHLKNEWWQSLTKIKNSLDSVIVGLTATPPYDVTGAEWQRYMDMNGPVDTEISVPELILENDLCPHQDYVYLTLPTEKENEKITQFRQTINKLYLEISTDTTLVEAITNHPIWRTPLKNLDWIYNNLSYYSSCLIFLHSNSIEVSKEHLEVIGDKKLSLPPLDYNWLTTLLEFYLYKDKEYFNDYTVHKDTIENKLKRHGAIERRQINFSHNRKVTESLTTSISKLNGIKEIADFEYNQLGSDLRLVILTDYIRKEFFVNTPENNLELNKIGVMPIFEKLRRQNIKNKKIGVLTGSLVIIPKTALPIFKEKAAPKDISFSAVPFDDNYLLIHPTEDLKHAIVHIVTEVFQSGEIQILIGTKALLGEGWDAPAINSLILASFVGSFVLSNQMRGRAIRTQKNNSEKTGNIWHIACIDSTTPSGGDDYELLKRRFRSFVGISFDSPPSIENGINRLRLSNNISSKEGIETANAKMFEFASKRENLKSNWQKALEGGTTLIEEIKIPFSEERSYQRTKSMYLNKTLANFVATLSSGVLTFLEVIIHAVGKNSGKIRTLQDLYNILIAVGVIGIILFGKNTLKALKLYIKYRDISKDIDNIGKALLNSLLKTKVIHTEHSLLEVVTSFDEYGAVYCHLEGGTTFEKSAFINALHEIVKPVNNPRYVLLRKSKFMLLIQQTDYHSVPEILGRNKSLAEYFKLQWDKMVGSCELIFTRTIEGRKLLLKSRMKSLATQLDDQTEHVNKWR